MENNKEMKQPIETLLTELAVLEEKRDAAIQEVDDTAQNMFKAQADWIKACAKRSEIRQKIETIKTQISQANENS